jgi:aspartate/methionine/tyrosine aminotransferase
VTAPNEREAEAAGSPSARAMARFIEQSPGLRQAQLAAEVPGLPTLPELKQLARERRAAGQRVIDQSAGDIDDVGQPLAPEFVAWIAEARERLVQGGQREFRRTEGDAFGFPAHYQQQFPAVTEALARSWGLRRTPWRAVQTVSGRMALDLALRGLVARADRRGQRGRRAVILDALAWPGYLPLAQALDLAVIHAPAVPRHGLASSAEGLAAALEFARERELTPIGMIPIVPSNPAGVGLAPAELLRLLEAAATADLPLLIDAFYSPLAPEGHAAAVPLGWIEQRAAPEALGYLGLIIGETKVTSSQNKTGTVLWLAPAGHEAVAGAVTQAAMARLAATNTYPRPQEALVAYALHTFPAGVHAAMGPRYQALDATRAAMRRACDELALPLSIGGSFYGTAALVDRAGQSLIRDPGGRPVTDPRQVAELLISRFGLVGAPGGMFSPAPEASAMVRLTAAVTLEDVAQVRGILAQLVTEAGR